jgi:hypothetical protein
MLIMDGFIQHRKDLNICPPKEANVGQAVAIVDKYMKAHPEYWHINAMIIIGSALRETFPCP